MRRLLVFCKEPWPGRVKTRLAAQIGEAAATELAWATLSDTLRLAREAAEAAGAELEVHAACEGSLPSARLHGLLRGASWIPQQGEGLGDRLAAGMGGGGARVAVGSDSPDLPCSRLVEAFEALTPGSAIAEPATDGGYVLLGLGPGVDAAHLADPRIAWSSPRTLADTRRVLEGAGVTWREGLGWDDVDTRDDLAALAERLLAGTEAPACRSWLESHAPT